jgi:hypothetical protein
MDDSDPIKYPDYMNTICKKVIHYVAYDTDQEKRAYRLSKNGNRRVEI